MKEVKTPLDTSSEDFNPTIAKKDSKYPTATRISQKVNFQINAGISIPTF